MGRDIERTTEGRKRERERRTECDSNELTVDNDDDDDDDATKRKKKKKKKKRVDHRSYVCAALNSFKRIEERERGKEGEEEKEPE